MTRREGASYDDNTGALLVTLGSGGTIPNPIFTGTATNTGNYTAAAGSFAVTAYGLSTNTAYGIYFPGSTVTVVAGGVNGLTSFTTSGFTQRAAGHIGWAAAADSTANPDVTMGRAGANGIVYGPATASAGGATTRAEINKAVTAFSNAVAKSVFTVTVPNAAHHAVIELEVQGALGAGGAIGAGEAMATNTYKIAIVRTAGVATVATATAATSAVAVAVAGAATVTATAAVSAMTGAVGATQTFEINVTISRSGGSSDNHTALCYAKLINANATGVTIA